MQCCEKIQKHESQDSSFNTFLMKNESESCNPEAVYLYILNGTDILFWCTFIVHFILSSLDLMSNISNISKSNQSLEGKPIKKLLNALDEYCKEKKDEARFIVLVGKREGSDMLTELLKKEGFKCDYFTGSSAASEVGGTIYYHGRKCSEFALIFLSSVGVI